MFFFSYIQPSCAIFTNRLCHSIHHIHETSALNLSIDTSINHLMRAEKLHSYFERLLSVFFLLLPHPLRDFFHHFTFFLPCLLFTLVPSPTSPLSTLDPSLSVCAVQTSHRRCCCDNVKKNRYFVSSRASRRWRGCYFHHLFANASLHLQPLHHVVLHCCADIIYQLARLAGNARPGGYWGGRREVTANRLSRRPSHLLTVMYSSEWWWILQSFLLGTSLHPKAVCDQYLSHIWPPRLHPHIAAIKRRLMPVCWRWNRKVFGIDIWSVLPSRCSFFVFFLPLFQTHTWSAITSQLQALR